MTGKRDHVWSGKVTRESNALDLDEGVFSWDDPERIAMSLQQSAERSTRRKAGPFRSAMSMLVFYINRAGQKLDPQDAYLSPAYLAMIEGFHMVGGDGTPVVGVFGRWAKQEQRGLGLIQAP